MIVPDHLAPLHHEHHLLQLPDVRQRIAGHGDEVRGFAGFESADPILDVEEVA